MRVFSSIAALYPGQENLLRFSGNLLEDVWRKFNDKNALRHAIRIYKLAVALRPDRAHGWRMLAYAYLHYGDLKNADRALKEALKVFKISQQTQLAFDSVVFDWLM